MAETRFTQFSTAFLNFIVKPKTCLGLTMRIVLQLFQIFQELPLHWLSSRAAHQIFSHPKKDEKT
jgi:hypothetical protein